MEILRYRYEGSQLFIPDRPKTEWGRSGRILLYWNLNNRQPFLGVFLVPDTIDIACAMLTNHLIAVFLDVAEGLGVRLEKSLVGTDMFHAECLGNLGQPLKLDDGAVGAHLLHLFAVLDVDVCRCVLFVVFHSEAITWRRTFAAETLHLGTNFLVAHRTDGGVVGDDLAVRGNDD